MLVNSSIRDFNSKGMSLSGKTGAARPREGGRHVVSKFRRAVRVKITIEDRERGNLAAEFKREKIVSERRGTDETKSLTLLSLGELCAWSPPTHVMHTPYERDKAFVYGHQVCEEKNCWRLYKTPNF